MKTSPHINQQDLERLADAYFDGLLTRAEESDLRKVLAYTDCDSPALRSARAAMGVEAAMRRRPIMALRRRRRAAWSWLSVAASVTVLAAVGAFALFTGPRAGSPEIAVYCRGEAVSDPAEAIEMARAEMSESQECMHEALLAQNIQLCAARDIAEADTYLHNLQLQ